MKSLKTKLILYFGSVLLIFSLFMGLVSYVNSMAGMANIQKQMLLDKIEGDLASSTYYFRNFYGDVKKSGDTLYGIDEKNIEGNYEMVDAILEDLGDVATIFVKSGDDFKRISTNIKSDNGDRAVGTFLGKDSAAYETVMNGETYIGEANILGEAYYTGYKPIKNGNDEIVGLLFIGTSMKDSENFMKAHGLKNIRNNIILIVLGLIVGQVFVNFIAKGLTDPIIQVSNEMEKISKYDLTIDKESKLEILSNKKDEIGTISRSVVDVQKI